MIRKLFAAFLLLFSLVITLSAQRPQPPVPAEILLGNENIYFQLAFKKKFSPASKFNFFSLATYTADYGNDPGENRLIILAQGSYTIGKGFGVMAGTDMNSVVGFSPVVGPQHHFASRQFLAVTILSYFLNEGNDLKLFGLYEYKPPINDNWSIYTRVQFIYNHSLAEGEHNRSYLYLRAGVKRNALIVGVGAQLDQFGPSKVFKDNYGVFVRWEFN